MLHCLLISAYTSAIELFLLQCYSKFYRILILLYRFVRWYDLCNGELPDLFLLLPIHICKLFIIIKFGVKKRGKEKKNGRENRIREKDLLFVKRLS